MKLKLISVLKNYFFKLEQWQMAAYFFYAIAYAMVIITTAFHSLEHAYDSTPFYSWFFEPYKSSFVRPLLFGGLGVFAFFKSIYNKAKNDWILTGLTLITIPLLGVLLWLFIGTF